jgi:hypothetical protein
MERSLINSGSLNEGDSSASYQTISIQQLPALSDLSLSAFYHSDDFFDMTSFSLLSSKSYSPGSITRYLDR